MSEKLRKLEEENVMLGRIVNEIAALLPQEVLLSELQDLSGLSRARVEILERQVEELKTHCERMDWQKCGDENCCVCQVTDELNKDLSRPWTLEEEDQTND